MLIFWSRSGETKLVKFLNMEIVIYFYQIYPISCKLGQKFDLELYR